MTGGAVRLLVPLLLAATGAGCSTGRTARPVQSASIPSLVYEDVTAASGIAFRHHNGARGRKYMPETMGSGCALVDVDRDGRLDAVLVDSTAWPGEGGEVGQCRLFRNRGPGRFEDASDAYGMPRDLYGMGVAAGDYDGDGWTDLLITALGESRLLRNVEGRRFEDVTRGSGIRTPGWPTSAAWLDYDRDGRLDLFVCNYVKWSRKTDVFATLDGTHKSYARPDAYDGAACQLFRNLGGRFQDVSAAAGVDSPNAKALGVALCDYDRDGWVDLAVSNDTVPNFLFHNQGNGTFQDVAMQAGMAVAEAGRAKAGMGIDAADWDNSGQQSILITNFAGEQLSLYRRDESGLFMDVAARAGVGIPSQKYLGFGAFFVDADLDGRQDIFVANGHIHDDVSRRSSSVTYAQPALLFRGEAGGHFRDVTATAGALAQPRVARGAAWGDVDRDGDPDFLLSTSGGPAALLRAAGRPENHWIALRLRSKSANRDAIGAVVRLRSSGMTQTRMVRSGSSYLSQSSLVLLFGLGDQARADEVEVRWPQGDVESFGALDAGREHELVEGASTGDGTLKR